MVTYRNRDPEPSVRFRPPHPVFKVFAVLFCCVQLLAVPAFAVEEVEWVSPELDIQYMESGSNEFIVYGTYDTYSLDEDGNAHFETTVGVEPKYSISYGNYTVTQQSDTRWNCQLPSPAVSEYEAPYSHFYTDYPSSYKKHTYTQWGLKGSQAIFVSDILLEPGMYQIQSNFKIDQYIRGDANYLQPSFYSRPVVFCMALVGSSKDDIQVYCYPDSADVTFTVEEPSYLAFGCTTPSILQPYQNTSSDKAWPHVFYALTVNSLQYRMIDPMDLAALDEANTNAGNTITDYDNVEQQWTGSMSENFSQLNLGGFSFGDGLISGFGLVSDLFMKVWVALGSYAIVYTFPLYLGIVLVLMGRVNRFIGHLDRKGDNDA